MSKRRRPRSARTLTTPQRHQLAIARRTLQMPDAMVRGLGGMTKAQARDVIVTLTGRVPRNPPKRRRATRRNPARRRGRLSLDRATGATVWQPGGRGETNAWKAVRAIGLALARDRYDAGTVQRGNNLLTIANEMLAQLARGVHLNPRRFRRNPTLAIVGANPPLGKVIEIRYVRDVGEHPGRYRHVFKKGERPNMMALTDGSLKIG